VGASITPHLWDKGQKDIKLLQLQTKRCPTFKGTNKNTGTEGA